MQCSGSFSPTLLFNHHVVLDQKARPCVPQHRILGGYFSSGGHTLKRGAKRNQRGVACGLIESKAFAGHGSQHFSSLFARALCITQRLNTPLVYVVLIGRFPRVPSRRKEKERWRFELDTTYLHPRSCIMHGPSQPLIYHLIAILNIAFLLLFLIILLSWASFWPVFRSNSETEKRRATVREPWKSSVSPGPGELLVIVSHVFPSLMLPNSHHCPG